MSHALAGSLVLPGDTSSTSLSRWQAAGRDVSRRLREAALSVGARARPTPQRRAGRDEPVAIDPVFDALAAGDDVDAGHAAALHARVASIAEALQLHGDDAALLSVVVTLHLAGIWSSVDHVLHSCPPDVQRRVLARLLDVPIDRVVGALTRACGGLLLEEDFASALPSPSALLLEALPALWRGVDPITAILRPLDVVDVAREQVLHSDALARIALPVVRAAVARQTRCRVLVRSPAPEELVDVLVALVRLAGARAVPCPGVPSRRAPGAARRDAEAAQAAMNGIAQRFGTPIVWIDRTALRSVGARVNEHEPLDPGPSSCVIRVLSDQRPLSPDESERADVVLTLPQPPPSWHRAHLEALLQESGMPTSFVERLAQARIRAAQVRSALLLAGSLHGDEDGSAASPLVAQLLEERIRAARSDDDDEIECLDPADDGARHAPAHSGGAASTLRGKAGAGDAHAKPEGASTGASSSSSSSSSASPSSTSALRYDASLLSCDASLDGIARVLRDGRRASLCFYGPPGSGKSEAARQLAQTLSRPLHVVHGSDVLAQFVGQTENNLRAAFREAARERAVLLFDEADGLLRDRRRATQNWNVTEVNEMLTQLERFTGVFIATTNLPRSLDPAVFRRFDLKVRFRPLGPAQRGVLLRQLLVAFEVPFDDEQLREWTALLQEARGLTCGDFVNVERALRFSWPARGDDVVAALIEAAQWKPGAHLGSD